MTENICRYLRQILQHRPETIRFLTTSTITFNCLASAAPQADYWRLGHVEPDGVVIADIAGQALDICLHGPESARKNGMVKIFTHTSIPIHPCTLLKQRANPQLTKHDAFVQLSSSVQCGVWRRLGSSADAPLECITSEAFSPRTVLTENICRCVLHILQHFPTTMAFLTTSTITLSCLDSAPLQAESW